MTMTHSFPCPPQAVIFDMDGLLVDSERLWKIAETRILAERGKTYSKELHAPLIGRAVNEFVVGLIERYELDDTPQALASLLEERVLEVIIQDTRPQPGAAEIVEWVSAQGLPYGIASSSSLAVIHATIGTQRMWDDSFPVRCSGSEVAKGKPAPDVYLLAAERLGVAPQACIALEDSPNGSRAAVAAGMTCFAVPDVSHSHPSAFADITPFVFASLHEALNALKGCNAL